MNHMKTPWRGWHLSVSAFLSGAIAIAACFDPTSNPEVTETAVEPIVLSPQIGGPYAAGLNYLPNVDLATAVSPLVPGGVPPINSAAAVTPYLDAVAASWGCNWNLAQNAVIAQKQTYPFFSKAYGTAINTASGCGVAVWNPAKQAAFFLSTGYNIAGGQTLSTSGTYAATTALMNINDTNRKSTFDSKSGRATFWQSAAAPSAHTPQWVRIDFNGAKSIKEIDVYTVQDAFAGTEPTAATTFTQYGIQDYTVQYTTDGGVTWVTVQTMTNNTRVVWPATFTPVAVTGVRVSVTRAAGTYARIAEIEVRDGSVGGVRALNGNLGAIVGAPTTNPVCSLGGPSCYQLFDAGIITNYSTPYGSPPTIYGAGYLDNELAVGFEKAFGLTNPAVAGAPPPITFDPQTAKDGSGLPIGRYAGIWNNYWALRSGANGNTPGVPISGQAYVLARSGTDAGFVVDAPEARWLQYQNGGNFVGAWNLVSHGVALGFPLENLDIYEGSGTTAYQKQNFEGGVITYNPPNPAPGCYSPPSPVFAYPPASTDVCLFEPAGPTLRCVKQVSPQTRPIMASNARAMLCNPPALISSFPSCADGPLATIVGVPGVIGNYQFKCATGPASGSVWDGVKVTYSRDHISRTETVDGPIFKAWLGDDPNPNVNATSTGNGQVLDAMGGTLTSNYQGACTATDPGQSSCAHRTLWGLPLGGAMPVTDAPAGDIGQWFTAGKAWYHSTANPPYVSFGIVTGVCGYDTCTSANGDVATCSVGVGGPTELCAVWGSTKDGSDGVGKDADLDGVPDLLESELAQQYFPNIYMADANSGIDQCDWSPESDYQEFYGSGYWNSYINPATTPRAQLVYTVTPYQDGRLCGPGFQCLEINYPLLYSTDNGSFHAQQAFLGCQSHFGDPEFYSVLVARADPFTSPSSWGYPWSTAINTPSEWRIVGEFTAAHLCDTNFPGDWESSAFRYFSVVDHPVPYNSSYPATPAEYNLGSGKTTRSTLRTSNGKHGTYFSNSLCDAGALQMENCDDSSIMVTADMVFGAGLIANAGESGSHSDPSFVSDVPQPNHTAETGAPVGHYYIWDPTVGFDADNTNIRTRLGGNIFWESAQFLCNNPGDTGHGSRGFVLTRNFEDWGDLP